MFSELFIAADYPLHHFVLAAANRLKWILCNFSVIAYILLRAYLICLVYGYSEVISEIVCALEISIQSWSSLNKGSW